MAKISGIAPMPYPGFVSLPNGTEVYNYYANECVAVANLYHEGVLGLRLPSGFTKAREWWERRHEKPELYENYIFSDTPAPGALFVALGGIYDATAGHIGQVPEVRSGGFTTLEQNTGPRAPQRYLYRHFRLNDNNVLGFLIPKRNPASNTSLKPRRRSMSTLYTLSGSNPPLFALAGDGQGDAGWLETEDYNLAVQWRKVHHGDPGISAIPLSAKTWQSYRGAYTSGGGGVSGGASPAEIAKAVNDDAARRMAS